MGRQNMADKESLKKEKKRPENTSWKNAITYADGQTDSQFIIKEERKMNDEMEKLMAMKKIIELDERYYMMTIDKETGWEGTATFIYDMRKKPENKEGKIRVHEEHEDRNQIVSYREFIERYQFDLLWF